MAEDANNITDNNQVTTPDGGKTFTQADVDRIIAETGSPGNGRTSSAQSG